MFVYIISASVFIRSAVLSFCVAFISSFAVCYLNAFGIRNYGKRQRAIASNFFFSQEEQKVLIQTFLMIRKFKRNNCSKIAMINRFAAIFNIPRNATINPEVEYSVYYSELPGC